MNTPELFYIVAIINAVLGLGTLILLIAKLTNAPFWNATNKHFKKYGLHYAFAATTLSTLASLWLSEIAGITPCFLCWVQRAFMYPLAVFLGLKILDKQKFYPAALAVISALLVYLGVQVVPQEYMSLYVWYAFTTALPLALYLIYSHTVHFSEKRYALYTAIIGGLIALYHYGVQRIGFFQKTIPCSVDASCSTMYLGYWGFYSIPLMALIGFAIAAFTLWHTKK